MLLFKKNRTARELAEAVGVGETLMSFILNGKRDPTVRVLVEIAKYLNCTVDELVIR